MLDLKVQYFQDSPPAGRPYREEHFIRRHVQMELPVEQTALVPVLERARQTGLTIVHAPSPPVAEQFDQLKQHALPLPVAVMRCSAACETWWKPAVRTNRQTERMLDFK